ncbi:MAG: hydrogen gas-evolving membrane-bound hydrogenase subunit E, partial [Microvirgula sp.]
MPITATLAMVAAASMAGVPLLNGFLSKEMFFAETVFTAHSGWLPVAAVIAGIFSVAYSLRFILQVFYGPAPHDLPRAPHEPPRWMLVPSALLVLACLLVGILPGLTVGPFLDNAAQAILGVDKPAYSLAIWHGFNLPLLMSLVALIGGVLLYLWLQWRQASGGILIYRFDGKRAFEFVMATSMSAADHLMRYVSSRRLQVQLLLLVCAAFAAALIPLWPHGFHFGSKPLSPLDPVFALLWLSGAACAVGAAHQAKYHRLVALILAGGAGLATCLTFAWFSAPDLALTQITVEVVTVVLILLGLRWLPRRIEQPGQAGAGSVIAYSRRLRDFGIAALVGCGMAGLTFAVMSRPAIEGIAPFFIRESLPQGGGLNVVNVILVDFRGFDTLGEITVLGIVALTVYALLRR